MKQWEYKTINRKRKPILKLKDGLNRLGKQGWELVYYEEYNAATSRTETYTLGSGSILGKQRTRRVFENITPKVKCVFKRPIE